MPAVTLRIALAILTCLCLSAAVTATYSTRVSQGLLFLYTFTEGQFNTSVTYTQDQSTISASSSLLPYLLIAPVSANWSAFRQGVNLTGQSPSNTTVGIQSSSGVSLLLTQLSSAFTVEAWLSPACLTCTGAILGFGSWSPSNASSTGCLGSGSSAAGERDWMFAQSGDQLLTTLIHHGSPSGCSSVAVTLNSSVLYHHIVTTVSLQSSGTSATVSSFYNGELVSSSSLTASSLSLWDAFNYLQVAAARVTPSSPPSTWQGALYLLAMYRTALSAADVLTNYQSGLPNSAPVLSSLSQTVSVQQDAQLALLPVSFAASDFDNDSLFIIIQSVPAAGSLYLLDQATNASTLLDAAVRFTFAIPSSNVLAFSPANDSWGVGYGSVVYAAYDGSAFSLSATVVINVVHVVTPPIAENQSVSLLAGQTATLTLVGIDVDAAPPVHSNMSCITLLSYPAHGLLYQLNGSAFSSLPIAASALPFNLSSPPFTVLYSPTTPLTSTGGLSYNDSFSFSVTTKNTSSVYPATVALTVINPLTAQSLTLNLTSDLPFSFSLQAASATHSLFSYFITAAPSKGTLTTLSGLTILPVVNGSVAEAEEAAGVPAGSCALWSGGSLQFNTSVSMYAGRWNRSLDPVSTAFLYSVVDSSGDSAAVAEVLLLYPLIHHAPALLSPPSPLLLNSTAYDTDAAYWDVVVFTIVDPDAAATSAYALSCPSCTFQYNVALLLFPVTGALIRLNPARTVVVQALTGSETGSASVTFTCTFAACNAALAGLQLQLNAAGLYNLSIVATQLDTEIAVSAFVIVNGSALGSSSSAASTGSSSTSSPSSSSDSLSSLFAPSSKWFWVLIACGVGVCILCCCLLRWRRQRLLQKERKAEITNVAVELAKAVGTEREADVEARAAAKAADAIQALASPRGLLDGSLYQPSSSQSLSLPPVALVSPRGGAVQPLSPMSRGAMTPLFVMSPRGGAAPAGMHGVDQSSIRLGWTDDAVQQQLMLQSLQQQQQQLAAYQQLMIAASPRLSAMQQQHSASPSSPFRLQYQQPTTPYAASAQRSPSSQPPMPQRPQRRAFSFAPQMHAAQQRQDTSEEQQTPDGGWRRKLSVTVTPAGAEPPELPTMPQLREMME